MKTKFFIILAFVALFCACDSRRLLESIDNSFIIFRYEDESYKDFIITIDDSLATPEYGYINGILNYPKLNRSEPYFNKAIKEMSRKEYREKYSFDICELATEEKVIALHDHYYAYYPYPFRVDAPEETSLRNGKWENICNVNPLELPVLMDGKSIYSESRIFDGLTLDKITKKKRHEMTIDDIVNAINKVIDEGKLDKYSVKYNNY